MEESRNYADRKVQSLLKFEVGAPASMVDILYLINSYWSGGLPFAILQTLDDARMAFVRGDVRDALRVVDRTRAELDSSHPGYRDVMALRVFMGSMSGAEPIRWNADAGEEAPAVADALNVVSLCLEGNEYWHCGNLLQGLSSNRSAVEQSHDVAPVWRVLANLLFAKKLSDIHVSLQADRVVRDLENLIDSSGLHVFGALPPALRSVLHVQAGRFGQAVETASDAVRIGQEQDSVIGVKLALSTAATAQLALGEEDRAAKTLQDFHAKTDHYVLPDSVARAAFLEIALIAAGEGPRAAVEQIRGAWELLNTRSGCLIEDPARPAWLIGLARQVGDTDLAERCLGAVERLAGENRGFTLLESAAHSARAAMAGGEPELTSVLDRAARRPYRSRRGHEAAGHGDTAAGARTGTRAVPTARADAEAATPREARAEPRTGTRAATGAEGGGGAEPEPRAGAVAGLPPVAPVDEPRPIDRLSPRESEIARLVGRGMTNQQVATELNLSPHTVNFHLRNIFRKLSISTRVKLGSIIAQFDTPPPTP